MSRICSGCWVSGFLDLFFYLFISPEVHASKCELEELDLITYRVFHLTLFVFRTVVISRRRANQRLGPLSLWVPTGELTLSVTIKLLKQQTEMDSPNRRTAVNVEHGTLPAGE